jgi:hypothetical protein
MVGDKTQAAKAYEDFLLLWKDADKDLLSLVEGNREKAKLQ